MTKLIALVIIVVALWGGWELFQYWEKVQHEEENAKKQSESSVVVPEQLSGMPSQLEAGLRAAREKGAPGLRNWLKTYGAAIQDPRKAWIELDYCVAVSSEDPADARRVFAQVKKRTTPSSPVWPRIKQLEKTYD